MNINDNNFPDFSSLNIFDDDPDTNFDESSMKTDDTHRSINEIVQERVYILSYEPKNKGALHPYTPDFADISQDKDNPEKLNLDPTKKFILKVKTYQNGTKEIESHEKIIKYIKNRSMFFHSRGENGEEVVEELRDRNVVYVGLDDVQYRRIFIAANQMISKFAEEYKKNQAKHEKSLHNSFYERINFFKKGQVKDYLKKLTEKIEEMIFLNLKRSSKNLDSLSNGNKQKKIKEEEQEKADEEIRQTVQDKDKDREIRKELRNSQEISDSESTNQEKRTRKL